MQKYKNTPIITTDDDIFYGTNFADNLYNKWLENKYSIIASRAHLIRFDSNGNILPYKQFVYEYNVQGYNSNLFFTSGAGTLFPPNCFNLSDENLPEIYKTLNADDVYLNALAIRHGISKCLIHNEKYIGRKEQALISSGLCLKNNSATGNDNDIYIKNCINDFNKLYTKKIEI